MPIRIDAAAFIRDLRQLEADVYAVARQALGQGAAYARELAVSTTKWKDRTGNLRQSIVRGERSTWAHFVQAGNAKTKYAIWVEDGTEPHVIEARRKKALHFVWKGVPVFFRRVHHPGTKPTHFMRDARDAAGQSVFRFVESGLNRLLQ